MKQPQEVFVIFAGLNFVFATFHDQFQVAFCLALVIADAIYCVDVLKTFADLG